MVQTQTEWKWTLGWLKPGAVDKSLEDVFRMTPADVNVSVQTVLWALKMMDSEIFDAEAFAAQRDALLGFVRELVQYAHPDFVAVTGDLIQSAMGLRWNLEIRDAVEQAAGKPAATAMTSVTDALEHLGVQKVAIASPFRDEQNEYLKAYLHAAGFEVVAMVGAPTRSVQEVKALPPNTPLLLGQQVNRAAAQAEALYLPCPIWRASLFIEDLERESGLPVLTMLNSVIWKGLSAIRHPGPVRGHGRLLGSVGQLAGTRG